MFCETMTGQVMHKYIVVDMIMFLEMMYCTCFCYFVC